MNDISFLIKGLARKIKNRNHVFSFQQILTSLSKQYFLNKAERVALIALCKEQGIL